MPLTGKFKCKECGGYFDNALVSKINNEKFCPNCAPARKKEAQNFRKITDIVTEKWDGDREINFGLLSTYINNMKKKYNLTNSEIYFILDYMYNCKDNPPPLMKDEQSIYQVLFYYDEGKRFWHEYKQNNNMSEEEMNSILNKPVEVITIKRSNIIKQHDEAMARKKSLLDVDVNMDDLLDDCDDLDLENYSYDYSEEFKNFENWEIVKKRRAQQKKLEDLLDGDTFILSSDDYCNNSYTVTGGNCLDK